MDGSTRLPWAEALAIQGNKLIAVGNSPTILSLKNPSTRVLRLNGRLVMPGFIDNHTHFLSGGFQLLGVDLRDARNETEFADRIRQFASQTPRGRWITGGAWDHERWFGGRLPHRHQIDSLTQDNPVFVTRLDGHMGLANSLALSLAGITRKTPDPPGGVIVRDDAGELTGVLKDAAMDVVQQIIPEPDDDLYDQALNAAMQEARRWGVTSVQDITPWKAFETYRRANQRGDLTVRIYCRTPLAGWKKQLDWMAQHGAGDEWLRLGGLKAFLDGSLGSTTALFFEPYTDAPDTHGLLAPDAIPLDKLHRRMLSADRAGLQLSIHAIGDQANHMLLDLFEQVAKINGSRNRRFRIEHAQHLRREDIPRFAQREVIPSMQPYHCIDDGRWAEKRIGTQRIQTTYAFRSLLDAGARLSFGSDWNVAPLNPLLGVYAAVTRRTLDGKNPEGWVPHEKVSVEQALRCYTVNNAYAAFEEHLKGSLEAGKLADLIVLDRDLFRIPPEAIAQTGVLFTIVDGRVVYQAYP
ncbi:MAG: amidohydrolase [Acidobacteriota bacterium]